MWWLRKALLIWVLLSLIWGALTILLDIVVFALEGTKFTISWQTQEVSLENPVIPASVGFLVWGLAVHFWKIRAWNWWDTRHPLWYWVAGGLLGAVFVALTWTQRGQ
jgi:hypothetical protein